MKQKCGLTPEQMEMTREELVKDVKLQMALQILKELDSDIEVEWVKQSDHLVSGDRRIIQIVG